MSDDLVDRITAVLHPVLVEELGRWIGTASLELSRTLSRELAERVVAELQPDDDAVIEAIEGWFMDGNYASDKTFWEMGAGIREALTEEGFSVIQVREKP